MRGADLVTVDDEHPGVDRSVDRAGPASDASCPTRRSALERHGEQHAAHGVGQARHARAQQLLDVVRNRQLLADRRHPVAPPPCVRAPARTAGCRASPRTSRRSTWRGRRQSEPLRQDAPDRVEARRLDLHPLQRRPSSARSRSAGVPGRRASRNAAGSSPRRRTAKASASSEARSSHWTSSTATSSGPRWASERSASSSPSAIACGSGGVPVGSARRSATSSACRCGGGQVREVFVLDAVEQVDQRGEREPRVGAARARGEHAHAAAAAGVDGGVPEGRLADPGSAGEDERARPYVRREERFERRQFRLAADDRGSHRLILAARLTCRPATSGGEMDYVNLGGTGPARLARVSRNDELRRAREPGLGARRGGGRADRAAGGRGRRQLLRHRRRLQRRRERGRHRPAPAEALRHARGVRRRDEGSRVDDARGERSRTVAEARARVDRRVVASGWGWTTSICTRSTAGIR